MIDVALTSWMVTSQMAPYLLLGFLVAGVLSVWISPVWVERHLGGAGFWPILKSTVFGIPLPLCSCGVIPVTASIRNHGASRGAATAFLLSTPQTGVDSVLATYALLGPVFAVYRPLAALVTGVLGGLLVSACDRRNGFRIDHEAVKSDCRKGGDEDADVPAGKWVAALRYGFITLPADIAKALVLGILVAGVLSSILERGALAPYLGGGFGAMLVMMAAGIPIYVCSTASIPIAMGFMHLGASPGAAFVFLVSGPATNAAAIAVVWRLLGRRTAVVYLLTVAIGALAAGASLDLVYSHLPIETVAMSSHVHPDRVGWIGHVSAVILLIVLFGSLVAVRLGGQKAGFASRDRSEGGWDTLRLQVTGMTCSHCSSTVKRALETLPGVRRVDVDLASGSAIIVGRDMDAGVLTDRIRSLGYGASISD